MVKTEYLNFMDETESAEEVSKKLLDLEEEEEFYVVGIKNNSEFILKGPDPSMDDLDSSGENYGFQKRQYEEENNNLNILSNIFWKSICKELDANDTEDVIEKLRVKKVDNKDKTFIVPIIKTVKTISFLSVKGSSLEGAISSVKKNICNINPSDALVHLRDCTECDVFLESSFIKYLQEDPIRKALISGRDFGMSTKDLLPEDK